MRLECKITIILVYSQLNLFDADYSGQIKKSGIGIYQKNRNVWVQIIWVQEYRR